MLFQIDQSSAGPPSSLSSTWQIRSLTAYQHLDASAERTGLAAGVGGGREDRVHVLEAWVQRGRDRPLREPEPEAQAVAPQPLDQPEVNEEAERFQWRHEQVTIEKNRSCVLW